MTNVVYSIMYYILIGYCLGSFNSWLGAAWGIYSLDKLVQTYYAYKQLNELLSAFEKKGKPGLKIMENDNADNN